MFGRQVTLFEILGFKIQLDFSWLLLALLITWSLATGYFPAYYLGLNKATYWWMGIAGALGLFGSLVFHELAHSIVARRYGMSIHSITLFIFGGVAQMEKEPPGPKAEFLMAIAGPISSFGLSAACYLIFTIGYRAGLPISPLAVIGYLALVNSVLAAFNLVPAFPLDGGRVFRAVLWHWKKDLRRATHLASLVGSFFGIFLVVLGIFHVFTGSFMLGIWWFVMGLFLREAAGASYYQVVARTTLEGEPIRRFMTANPVTVPPDLPLNLLVEEHFYRSLHDMYPVVQNSRLIGCIKANQVAGIPREQWSQLTAGEVLTPCTDENTINVETDAVTTLSIMNRTGNSRLLVMEGDRLVGIVTLKDLLKLLALKLNLQGAQ
ncbi:site-2 protease family protein [Petrachloros mirabilis]